MPVLVVDERERHWHLRFQIFCKSRFPDWEVNIRTIEIGDYAHSDLIGIEHKSPSDFLGSLQSGKLFDQAHELAGAYQQAFIVVDGVPRQLWSDEYVRQSSDNIFGVLSSLAVRRRTPVLFTGSNDVDFMTQVVKLCAKTQGDGSFTYNPVRRNGSKSEFGKHLIASLPGVGPKRASLILEKYATPLEALQNYNRWQHDVKGIGKGIVDKVKQVLEAERPAHREVAPEDTVASRRAQGAREQAAKLREGLSRRESGPATSAFLRSSRHGQDVDRASSSS